nr:hypothetical protein [Micromonospora sp. DSM 115978]
MAESDADRARRYRRHKRGDHSLCVAGRCAGLGGASRVTPQQQAASPTGAEDPPVTLPPGNGRIEQLAREFVSSLPYRPEDPRHLLGELAVELARRIDESGAVPAAVGQLRILLMQLAEVPNGPAGVVDEMRVRQHQRQLDALLAVAAA